MKLFAPKLLNTVENTPAPLLKKSKQKKSGNGGQNGKNRDTGYSDNRI